MAYTQIFIYLQVLDFFTTLIGFKLGLVLALVLSKLTALALAGACIAMHRHYLIRWISYWYAGLIAWNLCTILAGVHGG